MDEAPAVLAEALQGRIKSKESRGLVLLFVRFLVYLVLAAGIVELFYPDVLGKYFDYRPTLTYFSLALFGLVGIIFLLDVLTLLTCRGSRRARAELVNELSRRDSVARMSLLDPVTGTFDRRYPDEIIPGEAARADRRETGLSFVRLIVERFDAANDHLGFQTGQRILQEEPNSSSALDGRPTPSSATERPNSWSLCPRGPSTVRSAPPGGCL